MLSVKDLKYTDWFVADSVKEKVIDFSNSIFEKIDKYKMELNGLFQTLKSNFDEFFEKNEKNYKNIDDFRKNVHEKLLGNLLEEFTVFEYFENSLYDKVKNENFSMETLFNDMKIINDAMENISANLFKVLGERNKEFEQLKNDFKNFEKLNELNLKVSM